MNPKPEIRAAYCGAPSVEVRSHFAAGKPPPAKIRGVPGEYKAFAKAHDGIRVWRAGEGR